MEPNVFQPAGVAAAVLQLQCQAAAVADLGSSVLWIDRNNLFRFRIADPTVLTSVLAAHLFPTLGQVEKRQNVWLKLGRWVPADSAPACYGT
jgi:hypothetical protein